MNPSARNTYRNIIPRPITPAVYHSANVPTSPFLERIPIIRHDNTAPTLPERLSITLPPLPPMPKLDLASAQPPKHPTHVQGGSLADADAVHAINDLDYLSKLTAFERAQLYQRTVRSFPQGESGSGWLSYLPENIRGLFHTLKSRAGGIQTDLLSACDVLAKLLARERQENVKLKMTCQQMKKQLRDVSARCSTLEGKTASRVSTRGVKRRREPELPARRSPVSAAAPVPDQTPVQLAKPTPVVPKPKQHSGTGSEAERKLIVDAPLAQIPINALPLNARKYHPAFASSSTSASASTSTSSASTPAAVDPESDTESLPTPSYPPFLSAPATPRNRNTILENPPSPPRRVRSANGRIQGEATLCDTSKSSRPLKRRKSKHDSKPLKPIVKPRVQPLVPRRFTPSPGRGYNVLLFPGEELSEEESQIVGMMYFNDGRQLVCRPCRIFNEYPSTHPKKIFTSEKTYIHGTSTNELYDHCIMHHPEEWDDLATMEKPKLDELKQRLEIKDRLERQQSQLGLKPLPGMTREEILAEDTKAEPVPLQPLRPRSVSDLEYSLPPPIISRSMGMRSMRIGMREQMARTVSAAA